MGFTACVQALPGRRNRWAIKLSENNSRRIHNTHSISRGRHYRHCRRAGGVARREQGREGGGAKAGRTREDGGCPEGAKEMAVAHACAAAGVHICKAKPCRDKRRGGWATGSSAEIPMAATAPAPILIRIILSLFFLVESGEKETG